MTQIQDARITDHPFVPKAQWWGLCGHPNCNLAESAHVETTAPPGGWPPDYDARTARGDGDFGKGPEPELPFQSTHDVNLLDVELMNTKPKETIPICKRNARFPTDAPPYCACIGGECADQQGKERRGYPDQPDGETA